MRLLLVRHGQTDWNEEDRFQGQSNIPLNDIGILQAQALSARLADEKIHRVFVSDLSRARQTANIIAERHHCTMIILPELREMFFGEWEGLTYAQIQKEYPEILEKWQSDTLKVAPPGGENLQVFAQRIQKFVQNIQMSHAKDTVLMVAHGGTLQVFLCLALKLSPAMYWQFRISTGSLSLF